MRCEGEHRIHLAQDSLQGETVVNTVIDLWVL
jgi:hypothetical protein